MSLQVESNKIYEDFIFGNQTRCGGIKKKSNEIENIINKAITRKETLHYKLSDIVDSL